MARNELSRKKFEVKRNRPERFDATPYVDIIMDKLEEGDANLMLFLTTVTDNPHFNFIFGKSSVLNTSQKSQILTAFADRLNAIQDFDSTEYVEELTNMYETSELDKFAKLDEDGNKRYDFMPYFEQYNLTKEQKAQVMEDFYERQLQSAKAGRKKILPLILLSIVLIIIPPFFIPNFLQKMGFLPESTGWLMKIFIALLSVVVLYFLVTRLFAKAIKRILTKEKVKFTSQ